MVVILKGSPISIEELWSSVRVTIGSLVTSLTTSLTPENAIPLLQRPMAARFTPFQPMLGISHGDVRLVCGCSAMETHFIKLPMNSYCADIAPRDSLELDSECFNRGQIIFYVLCASAVDCPIL